MSNYEANQARASRKGHKLRSFPIRNETTGDTVSGYLDGHDLILTPEDAAETSIGDVVRIHNDCFLICDGPDHIKGLRYFSAALVTGYAKHYRNLDSPTRDTFGRSPGPVLLADGVPYAADGPTRWYFSAAADIYPGDQLENQQRTVTVLSVGTLREIHQAIVSA